MKQPPVSESSIFSIRPSNRPTDTSEDSRMSVAVVAGVAGMMAVIIVLILLVLLLIVALVKKNKPKLKHRCIYKYVCEYMRVR